MLVRAFGASAFGLRGGIPMEAAQTNVYHAPASRAGTMRSIRLPTISAGLRCLLQRFESALGAQRLRNRGKICETKRSNDPLDTRAIPKAPHSAFAAIS